MEVKGDGDQKRGGSQDNFFWCEVENYSFKGSKRAENVRDSRGGGAYLRN